MKIFVFVLLTITAAATVTASAAESAQPRCGSHCRSSFGFRNQWGYGGWVHTWGLGGPADAPWVGGGMTGVTPYGPYPYSHVNGL